MSDTPPITLLALENQSYFLLEGEQYVDQLLLADGRFPTPVRVLHFASADAMHAALGQGVRLGALWAINPQIVERLRVDAQLDEIDAPDV